MDTNWGGWDEEKNVDSQDGFPTGGHPPKKGCLGLFILIAGVGLGLLTLTVQVGSRII